MPWKIDDNGDNKYIPSIYCKEELPTWSEVYEEFWTGRIFSYSPDISEHQTLDSYWQIPRRKVILATVCNQFNKMIIEDGYKEEITKFISDIINKNVNNILFNIQLPNYLPSIPIYNFPLPTGKPNPFQISKNFRIDISKNNKPLQISPFIVYSLPDEPPYIDRTGFYEFEPCGEDQQCTWYKILEFMIKPYKEYFEKK